MLHSTTEVGEGRGTGDELEVEVEVEVEVDATTVDAKWRAAGSPKVSVVKVDVEGGESPVMRGASELLAAQRPALLLEAGTPERLRELESILGPHGCRATRPRSFWPQNYAFVAE
jgi:methyltransferase FkbM-like protein